MFEHHPGSPEPVQLRLLGDAVRDRIYPFGSHQAFQSFQSAPALRYGQAYALEGTSVRAVLVALYEATDGLVSNWNRNDNWLSDAPLGEWYGVTTDDVGRVVKLDLSENQLSGQFLAQLGRLTDLEWLSLWGNQLQGEIPPTIGSLDNVHTLSIWANQLRGSIPVELGDMASLEWAALGINQLTGPIPPELGNLTTLTHMDFTLNQLSGAIPAELGNLTNLVWLGFWANQLSGAIPPELGNLTNLRTLLLAGNELTGCVPAGLEAVPQSDVSDLGLPLCDAEDSAEA